jgi:biopolymer transport protein ExbB/TolQ
MYLKELIHSGGYAMYPLIFFSILVWAILFERIFFLKSFRKQYKKLNLDIKNIMASKNYGDLKNLCSELSPAVAKPHEVFMESDVSKMEFISDKISRRLTETQVELKKYVWVIGTIASSAPFVGLLGTVLGIMESFKAIGLSGKSGFSVVSAGISESLIATAAGILVAVVALVIYNYLQTEINSINVDFKNHLEDNAELVFNARGPRN